MSTEKSESQQRYVYIGYQGKENPTEGFVAQYLPKWIDVSTSESVKGGLRTVQGREALHARLMKTRLRELGGESKAQIPEIRREQEVPFFYLGRAQPRR
jgi:hypothetical protein